MIARLLAIAASLILSASMAAAQDISHYRAYALDSSVDSVVAASGSRASDAKLLHERPAIIQELHWRAPYASPADRQADPVREIAFTFYNDALYQVIVSYDRTRTEGLTNDDILEALSATYGVPAPVSARTRTNPPSEAFRDSVVLARWETAESVLTLVGGSYIPEFQLILVSKTSSTLAYGAIREAVRLEKIEAPRRESEQRTKEDRDATTARDKTRTANKAAFRP